MGRLYLVLSSGALKQNCFVDFIDRTFLRPIDTVQFLHIFLTACKSIRYNCLSTVSFSIALFVLAAFTFILLHLCVMI